MVQGTQRRHFFVPAIAIRVFLLVLCLAGFIYFATRLIKTDREKIRDVIHLGERGVETKNISLLEPIISAKYTGDYGDSRDDALERADNDLDLAHDISIKMEKIDITFIDKVTADVVCLFFVSGFFTGNDVYNRVYFRGLTQDDSQKPEEARFRLMLENDGVWRIVRAEIRY